MEKYKIITKNELKNLLDSYPDDKEFKIIETKLGVTIIPLGEKVMSKNDIMLVADKAKTMIYSGNRFLSQVDIHSVKQDIFNIKKVGTLNTLLLPKFLQEPTRTNVRK
jgi:hypothetical protein